MVTLSSSIVLTKGLCSTTTYPPLLLGRYARQLPAILYIYLTSGELTVVLPSSTVLIKGLCSITTNALVPLRVPTTTDEVIGDGR